MQCDEALDAIEEVISARSRSDTDEADVPGVRAAVAGALQDFSKSSSRAIKRIYAGPRRRKGVYASDSEGSSSSSGEETEGPTLPAAVAAEVEEEDDGPNEVIFVVYL